MTRRRSSTSSRIAPGWSGAGQFVGSTAALAGLTALTAGADLPGIGALGGAQAALGRLGAKAGLDALGANVGARIATQGALGVAAGAGEAISEDSLGEAPLVAERTMAHIGLDALIGAGTQGLFEGAGAAIPKVIERFSQATHDADGALKNVVATTAGNVASTVAPEPQEFGIRDFIKNAALATDPAELAREVEFSTKGAKAAVQATKEQAYGKLAEALAKVTDAQDEAHDQFQMQHVNQMRNVIPSDDATTNAAVQKTADLLGGLRGKISDWRADPDTYTDKSLINQYEGQVNRYEKAVNRIDPRSSTAAGDVFHELGEFRRSVDDKLPIDGLRAQAQDQPLTSGRVAGGSSDSGTRHRTR